MRIGIDVESGERPSEELVKGAIKSLSSFQDIEIYIIGNSKNITKNIPQIDKYPNIKLVHAKEVISMHEKPILAVKRKKESTLVIGIKMLKNNEIDMFFTPGNTGATVAASVLSLGMIKGIKKPAMATFFPRIGGGETLILDIGSNPDANDTHLYHNSLLGSAYYKLIWNESKPIIGLLNMGVEHGKGSEIIKRTYNHMKHLPNFVGNVEGYNVFNGSVDIVVCDGFTGNSILKIAEATKKFFLSILKDVFSDISMHSKLQTFLSYTLRTMGVYTRKKKMITQKILPKFYGAAPLLGINGSVLIGHGNCSGSDVENAIGLAKKLYDSNYIEEISRFVKKNIKKD